MFPPAPWQLAVQVMQFRGYNFRVNKRRGYFLVAFADTLDAVRFAHSMQLMCMFVDWPSEGEPFCDPEVSASIWVIWTFGHFQFMAAHAAAHVTFASHHQEIGPDGRFVFAGPRIAMAINEGKEYQATILENPHPHRQAPPASEVLVSELQSTVA